MTHSGQGEESSRRVAREGIVLPSDGGEPLLPGRTGGSGAPDGRESDPHIPDPHLSRPDPHLPGPMPAAGSLPSDGAGSASWGGGSWNEPRQQPRADEGWNAGAPQGGGAWGAPDTASRGWNAPHPGPLPPEAPAGSYGGAPQQPQSPQSPQPSYGAGGYGSYGGQDPYYPQPPSARSAPEAPVVHGTTQLIPPLVNADEDPSAGAAADPEGATQYIPPVGAGALPPENPAHAAGPDAAPTQLIPPVTAGPDAAPTQVIPPVPAGPDAGPTQVIPPVPAQDGPPPPAGFENLFRDSAGPSAPRPAASRTETGAYGTAATPTGGHAGAPQGGGRRRAADPDEGRGRGRARGGDRSRVPMIVGAGVVLVAVGLGAGALMGGGSDNKDGAASGGSPVAATAPAGGGEESPEESVTADPAEAQAIELDKLLADSGNSRAAVIAAVEDVKACRDLERAAKDLRDAAAQRRDLVTRLEKLSVDRLPDHARLTAALTKAWKASESADNHYANWADQAAGKRGCRKGQARTTGQTVAANRASGEASAQKATAAKLWNAIARKYDLTERDRSEL